MSAETQIPVPANVSSGRPPGEEIAGPSTSPLVVETLQALRAEIALLAQARIESRDRYNPLSTVGQTDGNGDAVIELYTVPGGSTGHLVWVAVDEDGVTPGAPDTSDDLWHAIYAGQPGAPPTAASIRSVGSLLDMQPASPITNAQIPSVYVYGSEHSAPSLVGPGTFYLVIDGATASIQIGVRFGIVLHAPEP